jgi:DNA gyrase/topoisomerase IV subunit B
MKNGIQQIEFKEHIRKRPGMYLGGSGSKGIINLLKGLLIDCIEVTESDKYFFQIELKSDYEFSLDIEASNDISQFEETINETAFENFHLKACDALSSEFSISNKDTNKVLLKFTLDKTVFTESVDYLELSEVFLQWAYLNRNSEALLIDKREKYSNQNYFSFPEGIKYLYDRMVKDALGKPEFEISFDGELNGLKYQIFLGYRTDWHPPSVLASFANDVHTVCGGSLADGVLEGLINGCRKYVKDKGLTDFKIRKKKFNNGLILIAYVRGNDFKYGGSFKESLEDNKVKEDAKKLIQKLTTDFISNNKEKADKFLCRFDEKQLTSGMY